MPTRSHQSLLGLLRKLLLLLEKVLSTLDLHVNLVGNTRSQPLISHVCSQPTPRRYMVCYSQSTRDGACCAVHNQLLDNTGCAAHSKHEVCCSQPALRQRRVCGLQPTLRYGPQHGRMHCPSCVATVTILDTSLRVCPSNDKTTSLVQYQ